MFARRFATVVACLKILFGAARAGDRADLAVRRARPASSTRSSALVDWMASQQPDNPAVEMLQRQLPTLFAHGTLVALGLILLGSVKLAGALGFLSGRPWGYWLFVASLVALLPFDVRSAAERRLAVRVAVRRARRGDPGRAALVPPGLHRAAGGRAAGPAGVAAGEPGTGAQPSA